MLICFYALVYLITGQPIGLVNKKWSAKIAAYQQFPNRISQVSPERYLVKI
jgi:hypothetical protein